MSIRPIDMQLSIQKTLDVNKTNDEAHRFSTEQQMFSEEFKKQIDKENHHIAHSEKSEGQRIKDEERKKQERQRKQKNNKNNGKGTEEKHNPKSDSRFDVSI